MDVEPDFGEEFDLQLVELLHADSSELSDHSVVVVNVVPVFVGYRYRSQNQPKEKLVKFTGLPVDGEAIQSHILALRVHFRLEKPFGSFLSMCLYEALD